MEGSKPNVHHSWLILIAPLTNQHVPVPFFFFFFQENFLFFEIMLTHFAITIFSCNHKVEVQNGLIPWALFFLEEYWASKTENYWGKWACIWHPDIAYLFFATQSFEFQEVPLPYFAVLNAAKLSLHVSKAKIGCQKSNPTTSSCKKELMHFRYKVRQIIWLSFILLSPAN